MDHPTRRHRLSIARESFKFSCAHMTVFPDGSKERLHGHNYFAGVGVELSDIAFAHMVAFAPIKVAMAALCDGLRERTLLAAHNPHFSIVHDSALELEFRLCGQRYVLPRQDALLLPIDNVSVEALAAHLAACLLEKVEVLRAPPVLGVEVSVTESPGQGASCYLGTDAEGGSAAPRGR